MCAFVWPNRRCQDAKTGRAGTYCQWPWPALSTLPPTLLEVDYSTPFFLFSVNILLPFCPPDDPDSPHAVSPACPPSSHDESHRASIHPSVYAPSLACAASQPTRLDRQFRPGRCAAGRAGPRRAVSGATPWVWPPGGVTRPLRPLARWSNSDEGSKKGKGDVD